MKKQATRKRRTLLQRLHIWLLEWEHRKDMRIYLKEHKDADRDDWY